MRSSSARLWGRRAVTLAVASGLVLAGAGTATADDAPPPSLAAQVAASGDVTAPVEVVDPVENYINRVYADLFGREVDPTGLETWGTALRSGTPRRAVADSITGSDEFRAGLITWAYGWYLGRDPEPGGMEYWLQRMREGVTIQQLEAGFLASQEYQNMTDPYGWAWVDSLYWDVLGRQATDDEIRHWLGWMMSLGQHPQGLMSPQQVAMHFLLSTELLTAQIDAEYQYFLGRSLDPTGQATWVGQLQHGVRYEQVIGSIIASDEYYSLG